MNAEAARRLEADLAGIIDPKTDRLMVIDLGETPDGRIGRHGDLNPLPEARCDTLA